MTLFGHVIITCILYFTCWAYFSSCTDLKGGKRDNCGLKIKQRIIFCNICVNSFWFLNCLILSCYIFICYWPPCPALVYSHSLKDKSMCNKFVRLWVHCIRIACANEHCSNNYSLIWSLYVPEVRLSITLSHSTSRLLYKWSPTVAQNWDTHSIKVTENTGLYYTSRPSPLSDPLTLRKTINKSNKWRWI